MSLFHELDRLFHFTDYLCLLNFHILETHDKIPNITEPSMREAILKSILPLSNRTLSPPLSEGTIS